LGDFSFRKGKGRGRGGRRINGLMNCGGGKKEDREKERDILSTTDRGREKTWAPPPREKSFGRLPSGQKKRGKRGIAVILSALI